MLFRSLSNVIKYVGRAGLKTQNAYVQDLKKARWYLDREIQKAEEAEAKKPAGRLVDFTVMESTAQGLSGESWTGGVLFRGVDSKGC